MLAFISSAELSREALELLGVLLRERPASVGELVTLTGRAQPNVPRSLQLLAGLGMVRLVREGRDIRPEPVASAVTVDLTTGTYNVTPVAAASA